MRQLSTFRYNAGENLVVEHTLQQSHKHFPSPWSDEQKEKKTILIERAQVNTLGYVGEPLKSSYFTGLTYGDSLYVGLDPISQRATFSLKSSEENTIKCAADFTFDSWGAFNLSAGLAYTNADLGNVGAYVNTHK